MHHGAQLAAAVAASLAEAEGRTTPDNPSGPDPSQALVPASARILEDRTALSTLTVLNADDNGQGSLRDAINDTNRVFEIREGNTVTIAGLTITHGRAGGNGPRGVAASRTRGVH